jgi:DNA (cytosine-5)-methyltransferase 1
MFTGGGGNEIGLKRSGVDHEIAGMSEVDKYASAVLRLQIPEAVNYGDARTLVPKQFDGVNLIMAGFPCQSFSFAGKRLGFKDPTNYQFNEVKRMAGYIKPAFLLLENVAGLLYNHRGRAFGYVCQSLSDLGYFFEWAVLNSKHYGIPQDRKRTFMFCYTRAECAGKIFFDSEADRERENQEAAGDLLIMKSRRTENAKQERRQNLKTGLDYSKFKDKENYFTRPAAFPTICTNQSRELIIMDPATNRPRRLTPLEYERLMSWPDNWTQYGLDEKGKQIKISDTQRYKIAGNGVVSVIVSDLIKKIYSLVEA